MFKCCHSENTSREYECFFHQLSCARNVAFLNFKSNSEPISMGLVGNSLRIRRGCLSLPSGVEWKSWGSGWRCFVLWCTLLKADTDLHRSLQSSFIVCCCHSWGDLCGSWESRGSGSRLLALHRELLSAIPAYPSTKAPSTVRLGYLWNPSTPSFFYWENLFFLDFLSFFFLASYISFLRVQEQITTNWVIQNNRSVFSDRSRG